MKAQNHPIAAIDNYFKLINTSAATATAAFREEARIVSITYDGSGNSQSNTLTVSQFLDDLSNLEKDYDVHLEPLVLFDRSMGSTARVFCSVYGRFADHEKGDSILARSVQSFTLVEFQNQWKITGISIQNEAPSTPLPSHLWPYSITKDLLNSSVSQPAYKAYDPSRIYTEAKVDEIPVYPGGDPLLENFLSTFGASRINAENKTPFTIVIEEDGQARVDYVHDLSGAQIETAKTIVNSMLLWYPAIVDRASVKCRVALYIDVIE